MERNIFKIGKELFITSDEEINQQTEPCWCVNTIKNTWNADLIYYQGLMPQYHYKGFKKIILTTDQDLIADGVQAIDDTFLEWFIKNPSCEFVEVIPLRKSSGWYDEKEVWHWDFLAYKIIIQKEEPKQETLEEAAEIKLTNLCYYDKRNPDCSVDDEDIEDHKKMLLEKNKTCSCDNCFYGRTKLTEQLIWQQERMYSEKEVESLLHKFMQHRHPDWHGWSTTKWFEQFKKK